ncbi:hypothetical protein [Streptomyces sp. WAC06614]|uniref:hypothetical protein n=1 Tax=Streptomyces sp. WAC06614 TaxID=2487416 RepID=UPI000F76BBCE|nr:hypothetical protein [Streptomyces sp. WAC06614]RSS79146.1 hypothetical protein EF918_18380 [Streptomyces sp. WAC06614]
MRPGRPSAGRTLVALAAAVLCFGASAACGTHRTDQGAPPAPSVPASPTCRPELPTSEETGPGTPQIPTEEDTGTGGPQIPTEEDTGSGAPQIPTEEDTGLPHLPTDGGAATGLPDGPTDGGPPACAVVAGWYDMTRDFNGWYAGHRTEEDRFVAPGGVREVRVRGTGQGAEAWVVVVTDAPGKSQGDDAERIAELFGQWRREVYGDHGTVGARTESGVSRFAPW